MADKKRPPLAFMAINATMSFLDWALHGCPVRNPEEVKETFETHCRPCEFYNPGKNVLGKMGYCEKCGCHVSPDGDDVFNKIRDPLISCPLDPPKWKRSIE